MWCLSCFIDFFSIVFALANYNIMKNKHSFASCSRHGFTNSKLCSQKFNNIFTHSDLVQTLKPYLVRFVNFLNSKLVKLCCESILCSYLPQPHELPEPQFCLRCLGRCGTYGSYGAAVTGFPAGIKIDPGWGLYPINLGLLTFEVQNCLKNF